MDLYGQDVELRLLSTLTARLDNRVVIDVGAERGSLAAGMLEAGAQRLYAFDPHPDNAAELRTRFAGDERAVVHESAVSDGDGHAELHVSIDADGAPLSFGHTLLERADTAEIGWADRIVVRRRSLGSLIDTGEIPARVGVLKIDTEGHDLAVIRGMGSLDADVVMVEHWTELPDGLGRCPWSTEEMVQALGGRGFRHFAFVVHRGEFVTLKWDDGDVEPGAMGNLVFVHERVLELLMPDLLDCAGVLAEQAVRVGQAYMNAAGERLALVDDLAQAADARLHALEATRAQLEKANAELDVHRSSA